MQQERADQRCRRFLLLALAAGIVAAGAYGLYMGGRIRTDPSLVVLLPEHGAQWIRINQPPLLWLPPSGEMYAAFRKRFTTTERLGRAMLTVRALGQATAILDGAPVLQPDTPLDAWKQPRTVDLGRLLPPGAHELFIHVANVDGPCALLAYCPELGLATGADWEVTDDGMTWRPALPADAANPAELSRQFPRSDRAFAAELPVFAPVFLLVFGLTLVLRRRPLAADLLKSPKTASVVRWALLFAWAVLAANNIGKVPGRIGLDVRGHLEYIRYVAEHGRIPLATEGWQMFQAPLYYLLCAPLYLLLAGSLPEDTLLQVLSGVSLLCGLAQVEIGYRVLRRVFPERVDLQCVGMVMGSLLPMNLYMSQGVGNEPLTACFSSIAVLYAFEHLRTPPETRRRRTLVLLGLFLGLALLTKTTALLLIPPVALLIAGTAFTEEDSLSRAARRAAGAVGLVLALVAGVAGWYYVRNWMLLGTPFVGGWDPSRGIVWWQYPGFRSLGQFLPSREALLYPLTAPAGTFPDGIYAGFWTDTFLSARVSYDVRPPWNYGFVLSGAWLGLLPTLAVGAGIVGMLRRPLAAARAGTLFAAVCMGIYFAAITHQYLIVPIYSGCKATYALGLIPCYAVIAAAGVDLLGRRPIARAALYGGLACWALASYCAYFVL